MDSKEDWTNIKDFSEFLDKMGTLAQKSGIFAYRPPTDVVETNKLITITSDLPGMKKEDINLSIDNNSLVISGQRICPDYNSQPLMRIERGCGEFKRKISVPEGVTPDSISASYNNGVLSVSIQKPPPSKPVKVSIEEK